MAHSVATINENLPPFAKLLGIVVLEADREHIKASMRVRADLCTRPATLHGGAIMALADNAGALGCILNLPDGAGTTTLESKTNFLAAIPDGQVATAVATPLHRGRTTMVWRTDITREDGRLAAVITQTQMVLLATPG